MNGVTFVAAFPKSGITYLNYMLFHLLFDGGDRENIDRLYIIDSHEYPKSIPDKGPCYVKTHHVFGPLLPFKERAHSAICLVRDPIDVMMSVWDFKHLMGDEALLTHDCQAHDAALHEFVDRWLASGGQEFSFAGTWLDNVNSWLDQAELPTLVVLYNDLKAQPRAELERVLHFLSVVPEVSRMAEAVHAGSPANMRRAEDAEVASETSGAFYRPELARGYAHGHRFVGKMHQNSFASVLDAPQRAKAQAVFAPTLRRAQARARAGRQDGADRAPSFKAGTER